MRRLIQTFRQHPIIATLFTLALVATIVFGVRTTVQAVHWSDPATHDQPIEGWMTPGFVAHSWHLPRDVMIAAVGLPADEAHPLTLDEIAAKRGIPLEVLIAEIEAAIAANRTEGGAGQ